MNTRRTFVCIGDSIVDGYPYGPSASWTAHFRSATGYNVLNRGVSGQSAAQVLARFSRDVLAHEPDFCLILCGTNDFIFGTALPSETMDALSRLAEACIAHAIRPILFSPLSVDPQMAQTHWVDGTAYDRVNGQIKDLRQRMMAYAEEKGVDFFDLHTFFLPFMAEEKKRDYLCDGLHPTEKGYEAIAEFVMDELSGLGLLTQVP